MPYLVLRLPGSNRLSCRSIKLHHPPHSFTNDGESNIKTYYLSQKSSQMSKDPMISGIHQNRTMASRKLLGYVRSARDLMQIIPIRNACLYRDFVFSKNNSFENRIPANVLGEISMNFLDTLGGGLPRSIRYHLG